MVKMQGYGNYEFKPDTNLFSFIDYCYSKDPATTMACAYRAGTTAENEWNYTKLMNYRDRAINTDFFKHFWQNMSSLYTNFKDYQDDFFFLHYTYPATQKVGINLAMMRNLQNEGESVKEYLTCLTSYIFSITPQAQIEGMTFGRGDVVPFLYYKDGKHANIDVRNDSEALMDIAKYAYVALIEGWCTLPTPYHLWENEYNWLFGNYDPENLDYDLETLHEWYDETYQRYCKDKGRKGNNLLGSTIEHVIESDYSIEQQLEAVEQYIRDIFTELGIETDFKETMARNELMAKYMMQNSNFDATIKDYNVTIKFMTENLQRGTHEEQNTHTVVTSDFQKLEFPYTSNQRFLNHSDEDGISDGAELGSEKWINITEFVKRTYEDAVRSGQPHKATFEAQVEDIIEKNGAYTDFNGNKVYGSVKWNDDKTKVLYRVYDYKSNPKLNDTDFDGLNDNIDNKPLNNYHNVKMDIEENRRLSMTHGSEYRHFAGMPNKYNSELAQMSLVFSNIANGGREIDIDQDLNGNINITQYMQTVGFMPLTQVNLFNNRGKAYIGLKELQYYNSKKYIYGVFVGGFTDKTSFQELLFDTTGLVEDKFKNIASTIKNQLDNYKNLSAGNNCCYFVTGMDIAGGVANILASELLDEEVYCYTFDPPNISKEDKGVYTYIKNIVNEDSLIPKVYNKNDGYHINGDIYNQSIRYDIEFKSYLRKELKGYIGDYKVSNTVKDGIDEVKNIYGNESNVNDYFKGLSEKLYGSRLTPSPLYLYNSDGTMKYMHLYEDKYEYDMAYLKKCGFFITDFFDGVANSFFGTETIDKGNIKDAAKAEAKSVVAETIDGFDKEDHYDDRAVEVDSSIDKSDSSITQALKDITTWYVENVATYQGRLQTIPLYQYKGEFKYLSKYNFLNTNGTGGDRYVMTSAEQGDALENQSLVGFNDYLKSVYSQYRENKDVQQAENYLIAVLPNTLMHNILRANERQSKNYREKYPKDTSNVNENTEIKLGNVYYYPDCEFLNKFSSYKRPGDDCTRFAFAVLEKGTGEEARNLGNLSREAIQFIDDDDIGGTIEKMSIYFDIYVGNDFINEFRNGLKTGDMLVGIDGDGDNDRNHCEFIYKDGSANQHVYDVFGWGQVKYTDKSQANFVEDGNKLKNTYDGDYLYSALYRKKVQ